MNGKTEKATMSLETTKEIYFMVKNYYQEAWQVKNEGKPVAWMGVGDPIEIFRAMDILPVFPENFSAACGAKQLTARSCEVAENEGFAHELCSYFRNTYGYMVNKELPTPPGGGMPAPDLLTLVLNSCKIRTKWWRIMEDYYRVPTFIMEAPNLPWTQKGYALNDHYLKYVVGQLEKLIEFLEDYTGKKLDFDRLKEMLTYTDQAAVLYEEILELRKAVPCPMGAEDMAGVITPTILLRGTQQAVTFYKKLVTELQQKVKKGQGVLPEEKFRIVVDNIPPWYTKGLYNYFHRYGGLCVAETYTSVFGWHCRMDPAKPLESIARACSINWLNISYEERRERFLKLVGDYQIDGAIFLANKGCKVYSGSNTFLANLLKKETGISSLVLEADQTDPRDYNDTQVKLRIDAFIEMLANQ